MLYNLIIDIIMSMRICFSHVILCVFRAAVQIYQSEKIGI